MKCSGVVFNSFINCFSRFSINSSNSGHCLNCKFKLKELKYSSIPNGMYNAGVVNTSYHETSDGIENTFAVNHLGYFLFTNLLLHKLKGERETRIINVSSAAPVTNRQV